MTGAIYLAAEVGKLGFVANFLSRPILIGYLNGVAFMVLAGQLAKLFGYASSSGAFADQILAFAAHVIKRRRRQQCWDSQRSTASC